MLGRCGLGWSGGGRFFVFCDIRAIFSASSWLGISRRGGDDRFFSAWLPGVLPDDGVHPNDAGQRLYAANLADGLAAAFEAARR